jgi:hypothetical protein
MIKTVAEGGGVPIYSANAAEDRVQSQSTAVDKTFRLCQVAFLTMILLVGGVMKRSFIGGALAVLTAGGLVVAAPNVSTAADSTSFQMKSAQTCLPNARGRVTLNALGIVEAMHVEVFNLPPNTDFDLFVIQVPLKPFGLAWYQGDIETNAVGFGAGDFFGRFSRETFIVAPGVAPAPKVFPDNAIKNPATPPVQIYHLGIWFNSPADAKKALCPGTITPFNGTHNAGVQVLNTSNFTGNGPLFFFHP